MNLEEMLEFTASQYLDDRTDLVDGDPDSLWTDALLVRYFNHAARILARRAWCIIEYGVAPAGVIVLETDKVLYPLHKSILRVFDATPTTQLDPLGRTEDLMIRNPDILNRHWYDSFSAYEVGEYASLSDSSVTTGTALAFATDAGTRVLRVSPPPSSTENGVRVMLRVARLPIIELTMDDTAASPEVPEEYHEDLCLYAAGRCLTQPMVDSQYKVDGRNLLAEFADLTREARRDRQRAEMGPSRWGFNSTTAVIR